MYTLSTGSGNPHNNMNSKIEHICVCICTYKRRELLRRLLGELGKQVTDGLFTYSILVVDNDHLRSAEAEVSSFSASSPIPIQYYVEPRQNIAMARNKAVKNASGEFVAFIDDDEFPAKNWLLTLLKASKKYDVSGVLGPVNCHFDEEPPKWIVKGEIWQRPTYPTGMMIDRRMGRTGNVLLKKEIFGTNPKPFRPEYRAGSDEQFFSSMIDQGHAFVYCNEAVVYEVVPPNRWKRSFILKRSLFQGSFCPLGKTFGAADFMRSLIAIPVYAAALPFVAIRGHHRFMKLSVKLAYHLGTILSCLGVEVSKRPYVTS